MSRSWRPGKAWKVAAVLTGVAWALIGYLTSSYPSTWIAYPEPLGWTFIAGGAFTIAAVYHPSRRVLIAAAGLTVAAHATRALFLGLEIGARGVWSALTRSAEPITVSFTIATVQQFLYTLALVYIWRTVIEQRAERGRL